jgi:16S rRNA (uracil1498-N3)-methyltransferase
MSRFFAPKENIKGNIIYIDGQEARHILNSMRLKENDKVVVFDGTGKEYTGFIKNARPKSLTVEIIKARSPKIETIPEITLAQAIPKKEKMDYVIEKATELGVHAIIPIITERTIVRLEKNRAANKVVRWNKIAVAAAKQCGRRDVPEIKDVRKFYNVIDDIDKFDLALMAHLSEDTTPFKEAITEFTTGKIIIFIGPEGDFTPDEILMAKNTSCKFISLGNRVLKSDTAGVFALSVLNYEFSR